MLRDESIAESAKQRSLRVPLDHYERPDRLVRTKWLLSVVAVGAAVIYFGWLIVGGRAGHKQASPGPVAAVHAGWNDDCLACHKNFQPLRADAVNLAGLVSGHAAQRESLDQGCIKCHNTPVHHAAAKPDEVPSCAACHREHQGRMADIVRPSDVNCLGCHRDNDLHRNGPSGLSPHVANVTGFGPAPPSGDGPHPDFRSLQSDPGNIKFNHWLHLQPGIAIADAKHKLKLSDLDQEQRPNYAAYAKAGDLIQLDCAACHQPDAAGGKTMRPIAFERHCKACHPLQLKNAERTPPSEVPHGLSAARLTAVLDGLLFAAERKQRDSAPPTSDESGAAPLIPGKTLGRNLAQKISEDILGRRANAAREISTKCQECHYPREAMSGATADVPDVLPSNIPTVWLRHARFDHSAHRHVECRVCHQEAYVYEQHEKPQFITPLAGNAAARDDKQVMIAGLESCAKCHAPARGSTGGARHDCAECHNYHGGDHSLPASFLGSALGTNYLEAPASSVPRHQVDIRLAAFTTLANPSTPFVGASSCASAGCHGDVRSDLPAWRTAFTIWATRDPHAQAYDVLWTFRGREMTRLLDGRAKGGASRSENEPLSDAEHFQAIERRCIGCHATPSPPGSATTAESYSLGVHCESCHGPAGEWLHAHYRSGFRRDTSSGFVDTVDLSQRAATCMKCHVGPCEEAGPPQVVDHDLIAAGHPRLAFEFHSYFESKPAHWNRQTDEARQPGTFHFRVWLAGQTQQSEQRLKLASPRGSPDFAQLDCLSCHHSLVANSWRQPLRGELLRPAAWPPILLPNATEPNLPISVRLNLARQWLADANTGRNWDAAVQSYLAVRATADDLARDANPRAAIEIAALKAALANLGSYLARDCFPAEGRDNRKPTQYDSPTEFAPGSLAERIQTVSEALQRLEAVTAAP